MPLIQSKFKYILYSFLLSMITFIVIFEGLCYIGYINNKVDSNVKKNIIENKVEKLDRDPLDYSVHYDFINRIKYGEKKESNSLKKEDIQKNKYIFFEKFKDSGIVIIIIYMLLVYSLFQQFYIFFLAQDKKKLPEIYFYKSEWSINVAPMLGLLGTFFSIAILLNTNNAENLSEILIHNFFNATMTTIIGIVFYIISLYLKIHIVTSIVDKKNE